MSHQTVLARRNCEDTVSMTAVGVTGQQLFLLSYSFGKTVKYMMLNLSAIVLVYILTLGTYVVELIARVVTG